MIESEMDNNFKLKSNIEAIIFGMDSYASDRIQGRRRLERLLAGFNKDLKKVVPNYQVFELVMIFLFYH